MLKNFLINHFTDLWMEYKVLKSKSILKEAEKKDKKIFIFLAADYRNMGDVAITYAQRLFLEDAFPEYKVIEIPADQTLDYIKCIKSNINKDDIITTIGGGNMGDMYEYYETLRRLIFKKFKKQFTISFPQTIDFSNTAYGRKSLQKTKKVIKQHNKLLVMAREKKSYDEMRKYFGNEKIILVPDIVLYLKSQISFNSQKNNRIGICFRNDKEIDYKYQEIIDCIEKAKIDDKVIFDTYIEEEKFDCEEKYDILLDLLKKISTYRLIYTNRLHAMIFSYITNTECGFIDNSNKKISETYKMWLQGCNSIYQITDLNEIEIGKNKNINDVDLSNSKLNEEFIKLKKIIYELLEKYTKK